MKRVMVSPARVSLTVPRWYRTDPITPLVMLNTAQGYVNRAFIALADDVPHPDAAKAREHLNRAGFCLGQAAWHALSVAGVTRAEYSGPMEPVHACRVMPTRHCPAVYGAVCGERPCARYESEDEAPWLPELEAEPELGTAAHAARAAEMRPSL